MLDLLAGVRVVECAMLFNGDQTGRMLADLGAEVIKVEAPPRGDYLRDVLGQIVPRHSPGHLYANRNKRSITLNLKSDEGKRVFFELISTADIFVDGLAGDACDRLGIGYDKQREVRPDIIYAQCTGFGATGPYAQIPTHGRMMGALVGAIELEVDDEGLARVANSGFSEGTTVAASYTAMSAVAALQRRARTGAGARLDGAGSDSLLATDWFPSIYAWNLDRMSQPWSPADPPPSARYNYYQTKDARFVIFCAVEQKFWENFCDVVGRADLRPLTDNREDRAAQRTLMRELQAIFHTRTQAEWVEVAEMADIAMGPANRLEDLRCDPQLAARGIIHEEQHPVAGAFTSVGWPVRVAGEEFEVTRPAPTVGQHTDQILSELGYDDSAVADLRGRKAV